MKTKTFAQRVNDFIKSNGNDKALNKVFKLMDEKYADSIELLTRANRKLNEQLEEAKLAKIDFVLNIDLEAIKSAANRETYAIKHAQAVLNYDNDNIVELEEQLEDNNAKIESLKSAREYISTVEADVEISTEE